MFSSNRGKVFVLNVVNGIRFCTYPVVALLESKICLWLATTSNSSNFVRWLHVLDLLLKCCSDINERHWIQRLFHHLVLVKKIALFIGISFFDLWVRFWFEVFSYCSVTETFALGFQIWLNHERIDSAIFGWNMPRFVDLIFATSDCCKNCSNVILFWWHQMFSIVSRRSNLVRFFNPGVHFCHKVF